MAEFDNACSSELSSTEEVGFCNLGKELGKDLSTGDIIAMERDLKKGRDITKQKLSTQNLDLLASGIALTDPADVHEAAKVNKIDQGYMKLGHFLVDFGVEVIVNEVFDNLERIRSAKWLDDQGRTLSLNQQGKAAYINGLLDTYRKKLGVPPQMERDFVVDFNRRKIEPGSFFPAFEAYLDNQNLAKIRSVKPTN